MAKSPLKTKTTPRVRVTAAQVTEQRIKSKRDNSPDWTGCETWSLEKFKETWYDASYYYNTQFTHKDMKPAVLKWMSENKYDQSVIKMFDNIKDWRCSSAMGIFASCLLRGMSPQREGWNNNKNVAVWLANQIAAAIEAETQESINNDSKPSYGPELSIQDRLRRNALQMTLEIDDTIDSFILDAPSFKHTNFSVFDHLKKKNASAHHARIIKEKYNGQLAELLELSSGNADEDLKYAYRHRTRKQINEMILFLKSIMIACDAISDVKKIVRAEKRAEAKPKTVKKVSNDKIVSKVQYKKDDSTYSLVSIAPTDVIGKTNLWVFNTKTRKLGHYIAAENSTLSFKGTSIIGHDENASVQKALRKPTEQLMAFKESNKVLLRKFLDNIQTTDTKLSNRLNQDIILLRAY